MPKRTSRNANTTNTNLFVIVKKVSTSLFSSKTKDNFNTFFQKSQAAANAVLHNGL